MPQGQYNFTGSGIGQTVGRYGLGAFGTILGGPIGGLLGRAVGGPLGGLVGSGLSSLFGPHGLGAIGNPGQTPLRGISMLIGNRGTPLSYTGTNNLFGANVPPSSGGFAPASTYTGPNNLFGAPVPGGAPAGADQGIASANPVGYTGLGVSNYGQMAKGIPAFAQSNRQNILARNII